MGDDLGVTPVRGKAVNLAEARAMQDARAAASAWDDDNVHVRKGKATRRRDVRVAEAWNQGERHMQWQDPPRRLCQSEGRHDGQAS